jgi:DNA-directed RNA polymerase subunit E'/Rpb7
MVDISSIVDTIKHVDKISIKPNQLSSDILLYINKTLKDKVESRCNRIGYIMEVTQILSISYGIMPPENFNSNVIFEIVYLAKTCIPKENDIISAKVQLVPHIVCSAGPLWIYAGSSTENIKKDDIVNVKINKVILNTNDHNIKAWGTIVYMIYL